MPEKKKKAKVTDTAKRTEKKVTRYTYDDIQEPRTPETGHTSLLPADELVVTLPMDNGWSKAIEVGKLPEGNDRPVVMDMDPAADPVLFWAGKRNKREVPVLPLQRNEIVTDSRIAHIIERARTAAAEKEPQARQGALFADLEKTLRETDRSNRVEFYTHEEGWKNKLICGDSLHVMESLLHYEGMRGKVQMIYIDPPYGIKYDSNFQQRVDSTKNNAKEQADDILTIKAFRDTWALGIHSYLSYLAERLYVCRELLTPGGSIFVQISNDNMHVVRNLLDEVFGATNACGTITFVKTTSQTSDLLAHTFDFLLWYSSDRSLLRANTLYQPRDKEEVIRTTYKKVELPDGQERNLTSSELLNQSTIPAGRLYCYGDMVSQSGSEATRQPFTWRGSTYHPREGGWKTSTAGLRRLAEKGRLGASGTTLLYKRYLDDFPFTALNALWRDTALGGFLKAQEKVYVVQTPLRVVERCISLTTQPGDLVFDPTCGSGTTAFCAEKLGRRWMTCDTSRVATNVARQRLLSATFEHFKTRNGAISSGFLYKTVDHVTLKSIANDLEPEKVEILDQPEVDRDAVRVCGPFEVMSLGRYSVEDWKGYVVRESAGGFGEPAKLENYIEVVCRLYRKDAAIQGATGLVHAVVESDSARIAISVGPLSGRVTPKQIHDAVQDAMASGILEVHVLGWAFEANVGEMKSQLEKRGRVKVELIMIRPDTLAEGLKITQPEMLFSPLALPDLDVAISKNNSERLVLATLRGVAVFDRKTRGTDYKSADSGYVSAWYLDEDYDGDCFVDCQMFFDFKKTPNLKAALRADIDPQEFKLQTTSHPFPLRGYKRIAVKVVDVFGNESTMVREIG